MDTASGLMHEQTHAGSAQGLLAVVLQNAEGTGTLLAHCKLQQSAVMMA